MPETLLRYQQPVAAPDGSRYEARACGTQIDGGTWQGWIEFVPVQGGAALRTPRETTQPNRTDVEYWATGLTAVYLEGALGRALSAPTAPPVRTAPEPSMFPGPAPRPANEPAVESILDPFSVYEKGEAILRKQLAALSAWHLVNIVRAYELSDYGNDVLNLQPAAALIDMIVEGVRRRSEMTARRR
jgi:hypothetical protein